MKKLYTTLVMLAFFGLSTNAQWQQTSLDSGQVSCFAISGNYIFAGSGIYNDGEVYLSSTNGSSWAALSNGLPLTNNVVSTLIIKGDTIFAGTQSGIYLSSNNGTSWTAANTGLTDAYSNVYAVWSLAIKGNIIYAGTYGGGLYFSSNNGSSWTAINMGLTNAYIHNLAINNNNIFAGVGGHGVYLSSNNGTSWQAVNNGLTDSIDIEAIAINGNNIFVGTGDGVFLSSNNGGSWDSVNTGLTNKGINALVNNGNKIFAGTNSGVFMSSNNGSSWNLVSSGLEYSYVRAIAINGNYIFAGTYGNGVYRLPLSETGIEKINNNTSNIAVYPNPAIKSITIDVSATLNMQATIEISNIQGQLIKTFATTGNKTSVDVSSFPSGVYVLEVKTEKTVEMSKFVKE